MKKVKWTKRIFTFDLDNSLFPNIIERLRGGPIRAEHLAKELPHGVLIQNDGTKWSIQENIGHLQDLESLWMIRVNEIINKVPVLTDWERSNKKTFLAQHNEKNLEAILSEFKNNRTAIIEKLEKLDPSLLTNTSLHPRLNKLIRIIDLIYFIAEHDDHHLAEISRIKLKFTGKIGVQF